MTSSRPGQQLSLDFSATPTLASRTQEPLVPSTLFGRIPQPGLALWGAGATRPANEHTSAPQTEETPVPAPVPVPEFPPASAAVVEPEPPRNQHNYRITEADHLGSGSLKAKCQDNLAVGSRVAAV